MKWRGAWMLASIAVVTVLTFALATMGRGFEISLMERLRIAVAADDKYIEVAKLLSGDEDTNVADAEGLLASRGFFRIGLEAEPLDSPQIVSMLETKGFYMLGPPTEPLESERISSVLATKGYRHIGSDDQLIKDPQVTRALASKGYYHIGSQDLIDAIRRFDIGEFGPDPKLAAAFQSRLRSALLDMMGSLDGPFEVETPGVLWGASTDFLTALDDLEQALHQHKEASRFLTEFWLAMANRRSVFGLNRFNAKVHVISGFAGDERPRILVCDENDYLDGRYVQLYALSGGDGGATIGFTDPLEAERHISGCVEENGPELASALAGRPVPLAVNPAAAREIFGAAAPRKFEARLSVLPGF